MKPAPFLLFLTLLSTASLAQQISSKDAELKQQITTACRGDLVGYVSSREALMKDSEGQPWTNDHGLDALDPFVHAAEKLSNLYKSAYPDERLTIVLSASQEINAWSVETQPGYWMHAHMHLVCVPVGYANFLGDEDEIGFILGHEIGHVLDVACQHRTQRTRDNQVVCEARADEIGFKLMRAAGYSPYAAAGAFGRIEMYSGDTSTGISGLFRQLASDHPITPNRIANMRRLLLSETHP